jgi:hypothetical protein
MSEGVRTKMMEDNPDKRFGSFLKPKGRGKERGFERMIEIRVHDNKTNAVKAFKIDAEKLKRDRVDAIKEAKARLVYILKQMTDHDVCL